MDTTRPRSLHGTAYEDFVSSVFRQAVMLGRPTRADLVRAGFSEAEVDEGVAELVARGFLTERRPGEEWEVEAPRQAVARYADETEHRLRLARATAAELESRWRRALGQESAAPVTGMDVLVGIGDITGRIRALHLAARRRLWWALDGSAACRDLLERAVEDPGLLRVHPGVDHRIMMDTGLLDLPAAVTALERAAGDGAAVRMGNGIPLGAIVCDDDAALLDVSSFDPDGTGSFETRLSSSVAALGTLLERTWLLAAPYGPLLEASQRKLEGGSGAPLDERDQSILALLASGASDQAIARRHGISVRTVERRVRYITEHLGAATRFHAGAQAVRRGWV